MEQHVKDIPQASIFSVFGIEALIAIVTGVAICCCNVLMLTKQRFVETYFNQLVEKIADMRIFNTGANNGPAAGPRIHAEQCCICMGDITNEVSANCGHVYCGTCIADYWDHRGQQQINCPLCRRKITLLIINFGIQVGAALEAEQTRVRNSVRTYNAAFAGQSRTIRQIIQDAPYLFRRFLTSLRTREGLIFFLKRVITSLYVLALVLYILSPFDLIPDWIIFIGWIDDLFALVFLVLIITIMYHNHLRFRV